MMNKKYGILFAVLVFSALIAGCVQPPEGEVKEIKIGIVAPLTGGASTTGTDMWQSAVLAAEEINARGGVNVSGVDMQITLVKGDTETSREGGVKAVTKLITEDKVDLLIGGFSSGITYADQVVASEHKVPFIITGASSPIITRRTDIDTSYFFHHCPTTDDYPEATLLFVNDVVKPMIYERFNFSADRPLRLGVLYQDSKYGEGVYEGIKKAIEKHNLGIEIVSAEKFKMSETDFRTALTVIKESKPDVVYPAAFLNEQTLIVAQGRKDVGLDTIYLSVECNDDPDYYTGVERWGEYSIQESRFSPYAIPSGPIHDAVGKFKEDFKNKWGTSPSMMGASTYEGVYVAAEAIKNAGTLDKEKVRASLAELAMPQIIEVMQNGVITFSPDYRESKFELYMEQLRWDETAGETRPEIVWPESIKETDFVLPDWYESGSS
ncbi:MAG: ABC transporter substrate-binding protein [Methanophagales archaeon]|nr:ABC transporter substrate-binding protein [Methanophagales archaeon]MCW3140881.1 ABC transporter substrate-binding protein [Methanophagales archaeon]